MPTSVVIATAASWIGGAVAASNLAAVAVFSAGGWLTLGGIAAATTAISYSVLNNAIRGSSSGRSNSSSASFSAAVQGRDQVVRSSVANRTVVYGRAMVSGPLVFGGVAGDGNKYLWMVIPLAGHEVDAIETVFFDEKEVPLDGAGFATAAPYTGKVWVKKHLGIAGDAADADLVAANIGWTAAHRLAGVAYIAVRLEWSSDVFPTGIPNIKCVVRGRKVYDPRTGITAWSANPSLCVRDYITSAHGLEATAAEIDSALLVAAANVCDESVALAGGGTEARYTCNGVVDTGDTPRSILEDMLSSMAGFVVWSGGQYQIHAGAYTAPALTLTADDLRGAVKVRPRLSRKELFNAVRGTFVDPAAYWQPTDFPTVSNATYATQDGDQVIWRDAVMPFTTSAATAQRIAKLTLERSRQGITVELPCKLTAFKVATMDTVMLTLPQLGWAAKEFKVLEWHFSPDGGVDLVLQEETAASYNWNSGLETVRDPAPDTNLGNPFEVATPTGFSLESGSNVLLAQLDGTIVPRIKAVWNLPSDSFTSRAELQIRRSDGADWVQVAEVDVDDGIAFAAAVQDGVAYDLQVRFVNTYGVRSAWVQLLGHVVVGKTEPPPPFDVFTVLAQPDGTRQFNFSYGVTPKPLDWLGAEIRYTPGTILSPVWDDMTPLQDNLTYYTSSPVEVNAPLPGAWTFAVRSIDTTGNMSTALVRSITLPDRRLGNMFEEYFEHAEGFSGTKTNCHLQGGILEADDATTWATLPPTWAAWTRWNSAPASSISYTTPARDLGLPVAGLINPAIVADGIATLELSTSADGVSWSAWGNASASFGARWVRLRLTVVAAVDSPVPAIRQFGWQVSAPIKSEYINDVVLSSLSGAYRIAVGDVRIPLAGSYTLIKRTSVVIQDGSAGTWTSTRIDQFLSPAPRWQFRLNGVLADPALVDFFVEGY